MRVKVIEVIYRFFGSPKQEVLKDDDIDLTVYPVKDDRVYNNNLSKLSSKLSNGISKVVQKGVESTFKFLSNLVEGEKK